MTDQDKEHLGKIMAYGKDYQKMFAKNYQEVDDEPEQPEPDRFDECKLFAHFNFIKS